MIMLKCKNGRYINIELVGVLSTFGRAINCRLIGDTNTIITIGTYYSEEMAKQTLDEIVDKMTLIESGVIEL